MLELPDSLRCARFGNVFWGKGHSVSLFWLRSSTWTFVDKNFVKNPSLLRICFSYTLFSIFRLDPCMQLIMLSQSRPWMKTHHSHTHAGTHLVESPQENARRVSTTSYAVRKRKYKCIQSSLSSQADQCHASYHKPSSELGSVILRHESGQGISLPSSGHSRTGRQQRHSSGGCWRGQGW